MKASSQRGFTIIELLTVILLIAILASIAVSRMVIVREKAYIQTLKSDLSSAYKATQTYFSDNPTGLVTEPILFANGFRKSPKITLSIVDGTMNSLRIAAVHPGTTGVYQVDHKGRITKQ